MDMAMLKETGYVVHVCAFCHNVTLRRVALFHETERNPTKPDETERLLSSNVLQKCIK